MKSVKRDISYYNKILSKIPCVVLLLLAILSSTLSLLSTGTTKLKFLPEGIIYIIYVVAACSIFLLVWRIVLLLRDLELKKKLQDAIRRWRFMGRMVDDFAYRTVAFTYLSFVFNMLFAISKGIVGWLTTSFWLITLAAYYFVLSLSKLILLKTNLKIRKREDTEICQIREWKAYRFCGILLMILTIIQQGMVVLIMKNGKQFSYHEILLLVVAMVDFYCLISAIIYMVRNRGIHTPIIVAIKNISFASSLVSMLSLQTAMFASYGQNTDPEQKNVMNLLTGSTVCILLLILGFYMFLKAQKNISKIQD